MTRRSKAIGAVFIMFIAVLLNIDTIFTENANSIFSNIIHCIFEGGIILMFSSEIRGEI